MLRSGCEQKDRSRWPRCEEIAMDRIGLDWCDRSLGVDPAHVVEKGKTFVGKLRPARPSSLMASENLSDTVGSRLSIRRPCGIPILSPPSRCGSIVDASIPDITASAAPHCVTLFAIGPIESSVYDSGNAPSVETRNLLGLKPTMPQNAAGTRSEPPVSEPIAISHIPSATATAPPDEEPPGTRLRSAGFPGVP